MNYIEADRQTVLEADSLSKEKAISLLIGQGPYFAISNANCRLDSDQKSSSWSNALGQRETKGFYVIFPSEYQEDTGAYKFRTWLITGLLTLHFPLRYHLKGLGKSETDICCFCSIETAKHILCNCPLRHDEGLST